MNCNKCPYYTGEGCGCPDGCIIDTCSQLKACMICPYTAPTLDGRYMCAISQKAVV